MDGQNSGVWGRQDPKGTLGLGPTPPYALLEGNLLQRPIKGLRNWYKRGGVGVSLLCPRFRGSEEVGTPYEEPGPGHLPDPPP